MAEIKDPYVVHVLDLLQAFGPVQAKAMFGGYGLYHKGLMLALIAEGVLYVKADDANRALFEAEGLERFSYYETGEGIFHFLLHRAGSGDGGTGALGRGTRRKQDPLRLV